jgi:hypothetical protein
MIRFEDGIALASMEAAMLSFRILEGKDITMHGQELFLDGPLTPLLTGRLCRGRIDDEK